MSRLHLNSWYLTLVYFQMLPIEIKILLPLNKIPIIHLHDHIIELNFKHIYCYQSLFMDLILLKF